VNKQFGNYPRYFSTVPLGPDGPPAFSKGFFELAMAQNPKPRTVAILAADAEFAKTASDGARTNAQAAGLTIAYDGKYPPATTDYAPVMRAVQAANADIVFAAAYPPDTVGIVRAANEIGLSPKMFGGTMIGLTATPIKMQLGPLVNGIVINESFLPALNYPGTAEMMQKYQAKAPGLGIDPLGYGFAPFAYTAGQLLAKAVEDTRSLDHDKLAAYLHSHTVDTVVGPLAFGRRRMDAHRHGVHAIPERVGQRSRAVQGSRQGSHPVAGEIQERDDDLSLRRGEEEIGGAAAHAHAAALASSPPRLRGRDREGEAARAGASGAPPRPSPASGGGKRPYTFRAIIICLISAIALAGLRLFGRPWRSS